MTDFVSSITNAANRLATAVQNEQTLEDERIHIKLAAIGRIMHAGDNPLTGKPHSFSSAEAMVNTDDEYQAYLARQRDAVRERILAQGELYAARAAAALQTAEGA
jgi:hypothetical protein